MGISRIFIVFIFPVVEPTVHTVNFLDVLLTMANTVRKQDLKGKITNTRNKVYAFQEQKVV